MTVGERIAARRKDLNMTQEELAKKLGYKSRSSVNKIELEWSNVPLAKIQKVAAALDCDAAYLMGWQDEIRSPEYSVQKQQHDEINEIFDRMPPELRAHALALLKGLTQQAQSPDDPSGSC